MFAVWMMFDSLTGEVFAVWMMDSVKTFTHEVFALWIIYSVRLSQVKFLLYEWWAMLDCHRWNVYCVNDLQCQTVTGEMFAVWMMDFVRLSQVKCLLCEWWTVLHSHRWSVCCVTVISVNRHFNRKLINLWMMDSVRLSVSQVKCLLCEQNVYGSIKV